MPVSGSVSASGWLARPTPVVLDVDTGVDDACALLFAARHPGLDLRAVTCVAGNAPWTTWSATPSPCSTWPARATSRSAAAPTARCSSRRARAGHLHGRDGMGDLGWPRPRPVP